MVKLYDEGIYLVNGTEIVPESEAAKVQALTGKAANKEEAKKGTMACSILSAHNTSGDMEHLKLKFDAMASHDITFVGIVQTAKASGMEKFPLPYAEPSTKMTTCLVFPQQRSMAASMFHLTLQLSISTCVKCMQAADA